MAAFFFETAWREGAKSVPFFECRPYKGKNPFFRTKLVPLGRSASVERFRVADIAYIAIFWLILSHFWTLP